LKRVSKLLVAKIGFIFHLHFFLSSFYGCLFLAIRLH
jgi:hypothetical protein